MNSAFEDALVLFDKLQEHEFDVSAAFRAYKYVDRRARRGPSDVSLLVPNVSVIFTPSSTCRCTIITRCDISSLAVRSTGERRSTISCIDCCPAVGYLCTRWSLSRDFRMRRVYNFGNDKIASWQSAVTSSTRFLPRVFRNSSPCASSNHWSFNILRDEFCRKWSPIRWRNTRRYFSRTRAAEMIAEQ
jgi:hypothetical protein